MLSTASTFNRGGAAGYEEPDPMAPASEKEGKDYGLRMAKFLWSNYHTYNTGIFYNQRARYNTLIAYAQGNQGIDRYKKLASTDEGTDNSWINIDWKIRNYATKRIGIVKSMLEKEKLKMNLTAVDAYATSQKVEFETAQKTSIQLAEMFQKVKEASAGNPFLEGASFKSLEELEMHMSEDYKESWAKDMEIANEYIMAVVNNFQRIREMNAYDLATIGVAAVMTRNGKNGYPENEYIDPAGLIIPSSQYEDFHDITKMGFVKEMSWTQFEKIAGDQFTKTEYQYIKENLVYNNQKTHEFENNEPQQRLKSPYENNRLRVMEFYFTSTIEDVYEVKLDEQGRSTMRKTGAKKGKGKAYNTETDENGVTYRTNGKSRVYRDKYEVLYKGYWICDSDHVFSYGMATNMSRDFKNINKIDIPIKVIAPNMKRNKIVSMVEQMMPVLDDIQNYTNKMNHLIASVVPKGIYIDLDAMDNANLAGNGGKNMGNRELLNLYFQKGVVVGRSGDLAGAGSSYKPIQELENGMANDVMNFVNLIESKKAQLDELIGFNAIMAASQTHPDQGKAVSQMQQQQTSHAIGHLYRGMRYLYEETCRANILNFQDSIQTGAAWQMVEAFGGSTIDFLKSHEEMSLASFGFKLEVLPTDDEWQFFYQQASSAVAQQSIGMDDYLYLLEVDNLKQARKVFELRIKKKAEAEAEAAQQQMEQNAELQQQSAAQAAEQAQQTEQMKGEIQIQVNAAKAADDRKTLQLDRDLELRNTNYRESQQGVSKMDQINTQKDADIEKSWMEKEKPKPQPSKTQGAKKK